MNVYWFFILPILGLLPKIIHVSPAGIFKIFSSAVFVVVLSLVNRFGWLKTDYAFLTFCNTRFFHYYLSHCLRMEWFRMPAVISISSGFHEQRSRPNSYELGFWGLIRPINRARKCFIQLNEAWVGQQSLPIIACIGTKNIITQLSGSLIRAPNPPA
uniref:Uncharacterized protein n=1 Tax=Pleurozia purpurea TaxID=280637 RepID=D0R045_9MARC|nr:hypothetical protein PlpuMp46 [Pleurozia purpurea]ACR19382.1 hypothetical protein PlpuMp46 [Pleurozia purpurea]